MTNERDKALADLSDAQRRSAEADRLQIRGEARKRLAARQRDAEARFSAASEARRAQGVSNA